jgi:hypothetical protein
MLKCSPFFLQAYGTTLNSSAQNDSNKASETLNFHSFTNSLQSFSSRYHQYHFVSSPNELEYDS